MKVNPELFKAIVGGLFDKHKHCNYLNCDMKTIESFALSKVGLFSIYFQSYCLNLKTDYF